ncbi:uncharacterized protein LOC118433998 [Folsomia candida]|uniref:uncharacterized protein LOC118433998 n=1 Tax=Folsomia candida TaxID=158441 RepID=UPI0016054549|nr:uncharacterized protein LOC118433998 [Folsomia candida]
MNSNNASPHTLLLLPEILAKIVTFLPNSDLISCTLINTAWEQEVRKRLHVVRRLVLTPTNLVKYEEVNTRGENFPRNIALYDFKNLSFQGPLASLIFKHGHKVKTLNIDFVLPNNKWPQYFESVAKAFPTLNSLKLNVSLTKEDNSNQGSSFYESYLPPRPYSFPKLTKLEISSFQEEVKAILVSMTPQFIPLFPSLVALSFTGIYHPDLLNLAGTLTSLKLINVDFATAPRTQNLANLTRVELGHTWGALPQVRHCLKLPRARYNT